MMNSRAGAARLKTPQDYQATTSMYRNIVLSASWTTKEPQTNDVPKIVQVNGPKFNQSVENIKKQEFNNKSKLNDKTEFVDKSEKETNEKRSKSGYSKNNKKSEMRKKQETNNKPNSSKKRNTNDNENAEKNLGECEDWTEYI